jgi:V/A-type H+-transporting ATPase subunit G/H
MDDALKRLLDAEVKAQGQVDEALKERDRLVAQAREEARNAEQRFNKRIPGIHDSFRGKAEERARQSIAEMQRRYDERRTHMKEAAEKAADGAVAAALERFLDVSAGD